MSSAIDFDSPAMPSLAAAQFARPQLPIRPGRRPHDGDRPPAPAAGPGDDRDLAFHHACHRSLLDVMAMKLGASARLVTPAGRPWRIRLDPAGGRGHKVCPETARRRTAMP